MTLETTDAKCEVRANEAPSNPEPTPDAPLQKPQKLLRGERLDLYPATLPRDQPPPLTSDITPDSYFPPAYFLGWKYTEDDFYERFANKDDEDAWDIYEGFKEVVTRPFKSRYPVMAAPDFDAEDESRECIVYIAYKLEEVECARAQDQALVDAAKDILEETREPVWYRRV
ncbi:hypothetical protein EV122DRAFT_278285 [Schizophyllum commune]|nr:hypothetical protein K525DRAFT_270881 [Schizophyllum commune Loenen D]